MMIEYDKEIGSRLVDNLMTLYDCEKQYNLAKEIGVTDDTITNWRKAKSTPSLKTLFEIISTKDITLDELFGLKHDDEYILENRKILEILKMLMIYAYRSNNIAEIQGKNKKSHEYVMEFRSEKSDNDNCIESEIIFKCKCNKENDYIHNLFNAYNEQVDLIERNYLKRDYFEKFIILLVDTINEMSKTESYSNYGDYLKNTIDEIVH